MKEPKVVFVKDLHYTFTYGICLYWIDEIHIDETLKESPVLDDIMKHELKHYELIKKYINMHRQGKLLKSLLLLLYNFLWDLYDSIRIGLKSLEKSI